MRGLSCDTFMSNAHEVAESGHLGFCRYNCGLAPPHRGRPARPLPDGPRGLGRLPARPARVDRGARADRRRRRLGPFPGAALLASAPHASCPPSTRTLAPASAGCWPGTVASATCRRPFCRTPHSRARPFTIEKRDAAPTLAPARALARSD